MACARDAPDASAASGTASGARPANGPQSLGKERIRGTMNQAGVAVLFGALPAWNFETVFRVEASPCGGVRVGGCRHISGRRLVANKETIGTWRQKGVDALPCLQQVSCWPPGGLAALVTPFTTVRCLSKASMRPPSMSPCWDSFDCSTGLKSIIAFCDAWLLLVEGAPRNVRA